MRRHIGMFSRLMMGVALLLGATLPGLGDAQASLVSAVLPGSRSVQVGTTATAFGLLINGGTTTATSCSLAPGTTIPATFSYQTTNPQTNALTGSPNTPIDLPAGQSQTFIFSLTPTAEIPPTNVRVNFACTNTTPALSTVGLNTLLLSASATPVPDIVALVGTLSQDGVIHLPGIRGGPESTGVFSVATVNVGAEGIVHVQADTGDEALPITILLCQTTPPTGSCRELPSQSITTTMVPNETATFGFFVEGTNEVFFNPATNRIFLRFVDDNGITRGSTSVAVQTGKIFGMNFSPYQDGQDPNQGTFIPESQLRERMAIIRPHTEWIRTFGSTNGLERSGGVAHSLGLKAAPGAWLSSDLTANDREITNLIQAAQAGEADLLIVGSEVLLRGDLSEQALLNYINRVKQEVPNIPVTYGEVYSALLQHPTVLGALDVILVNYYPYWEGIHVDHAVAAIHQWHQQILNAASGKPVMVSETGWPSAGNQVGQGVPSAENASFYLKNFVSWARAQQVPYFYFEAFDETWKAQAEGPQGAHWGMWTKDGVLKPGVERTLMGERVLDNWSNPPLPGGPGTPVIEFTSIPPRGSFDNLEGRVLHVDPNQFTVAVYISVNGRWWTKPTFAQPLTLINIDGSWITDITTGGVDHRATRIAAFLLPAGYTPPSAAGSRTLPSELDDRAVASLEVARN